MAKYGILLSVLLTACSLLSSCLIHVYSPCLLIYFYTPLLKYSIWFSCTFQDFSFILIKQFSRRNKRYPIPAPHNTPSTKNHRILPYVVSYIFRKIYMLAAIQNITSSMPAARLLCRISFLKHIRI